MEIQNDTPYIIEALPQTGPGEKPVLTIIVKGTFDIRPEESATEASEQIPVVFGDELYDPENGGSVKFESDAAPFKPKADIALVGRAHARGGDPVTVLNVSLRVGTLKKSLRVFGDRHWRCLSRLLPVSATKPEPFTEMELVYERAFGGIDTKGGGFCEQNLVGCGFITKKLKKILNGAPLPNIEDPESLIKSWKDRPPPAGFGFYGRAWSPRNRYLGIYDETWRKERSPRPPLDFSFDYYNASHPDLQVQGYLQGNEDVELVNLTPDGYLRFWLPGIKLNCNVTKTYELLTEPVRNDENQNAESKVEEFTEPIDLNLDTLCLIPDEKRFYLVWRGLCPVRDLTGIEVKTIEVGQTTPAA